jgi:polysaccharide biosynthesis protein PslH
MAPLRIAVVMIEPPLPFGNAAARWYYVLLKGLVERGHRVSAFAACSQPREIPLAHALFPAPAYDLRLYPVPLRRGWRGKWQTWRRPFSYMFGTRLRLDLQARLAQGFDILHLEQLWSGWLGLSHVAATLINVHYLLEIDQEGLRPESFSQWKERVLGSWAERAMLGSYRHVRTCTTRLEEFIRRRNPEAEVTTVPFALDSSLYEFVPDNRRVADGPILLIGNMSWSPSKSAAARLLTRLWPEIKRRVPAARLQIVGWSARAALAEYLGIPDVSVVEDAPEIRPYFESASVMLYAPGRGSGMKIKIQEAMAFGVPVVTTSEGVEGLPAEDGVHAGVCDDDAGLIDRTVALLTDFDRQNQQRRAARRLIETFCGPEKVLDAIEAIYARMLTDPH